MPGDIPPILDARCGPGTSFALELLAGENERLSKEVAALREAVLKCLAERDEARLAQDALVEQYTTMRRERDEARALVRRFAYIPSPPWGSAVVEARAARSDARQAIARWDTEGKA